MRPPGTVRTDHRDQAPLLGAAADCPISPVPGGRRGGRGGRGGAAGQQRPGGPQAPRHSDTERASAAARGGLPAKGPAATGPHRQARAPQPAALGNASLPRGRDPAVPGPTGWCVTPSRRAAASAVAAAARSMAVAGEPPPPPAAIPSFAVARGLVGRRYSCLVVAPHRRHVALAPRYLGRKRTGIRAQLDAELLRYSERCGWGGGSAGALPGLGGGGGVGLSPPGGPSAAAWAPPRPGPA